MKNLFIFFSALLFSSCILTGCGGDIPEPPANISYAAVTFIEGPLSGYVEAVPGTYLFEITKDKNVLGYGGSMKVKFKFIKPIDVEAGIGNNNYGPGLYGKVLDQKGVPLEFRLSVFTDNDLAAFLKRGYGEEWLTLDLTEQGLADNSSDAGLMLEKFCKGSVIIFNSEIVEESHGSATSSSGSSDNVVTDSKPSGSCDEFLDGYEEFALDYVVIIKKFKENQSDPAIISEYTNMLSKAQQWANKPADCENDPGFVTRFVQIQTKIATAASGM
jgi:hypothetical protein